MTNSASTPTLPLILGLVGGLVGGLLGASTLSTLTSSTSEAELLEALSKQVSAYEVEITELKQQVATQAVAVAEARTRAAQQAGQTQEVAAVNDQAIFDFLVRNPDVIFMDALEMFQANESVYTARRFAKTLDSGLREPLYNSSSDPFLGNPEGDVVLVEFFDYNCSYCKSVASDLFTTVTEDGNVKLVMKEFPILSQASKFAAQAALASQKQGKYNEYHTALIKFQGRVTEDVVLKVAEQVGLDVEQLKTDMQSPIIEEKLALNARLADQLGVTGTPAFMVGNTFLPGAVPAAQIKQAIASARQLASNS